MFALPPILLLIVLDYLKPQAFIPGLAGLPLLYIFTGLAVLGFLIDVRLRISRMASTPQLPYVLLFIVWCLITVTLKQPAGLVARAQALLIPVSLYLLIGHMLQSFRALEALVVAISVICLFLAAVGVHQGLSGWGCHQLGFRNGEFVETYDGRECVPEEHGVCEAEASEAGDYSCERVGLFGTQSVLGRVRFRGTLSDPNDLALALGIS